MYEFNVQKLSSKSVERKMKTLIGIQTENLGRLLSVITYFPLFYI